MNEAMFYQKRSGNQLQCFLCRHRCVIDEGKRGLCQVRENRDGTLYSVFYGRPIAICVDPVEKKPLYHFLPGTRSLSIATLGCNFQCEFCQNWEISQVKRTAPVREKGSEGPYVSPEEVVRKALEQDCRSISYTYSEPTIFFEYAYDIGRLARSKGIKNVFVTNGYMTPQAIEKSLDFLDAANVDLKAFRKETYRKVMKGDLEGVLDTIRIMKQKNLWLEITTLVVPGMNDDESELRDIARFIADVDRGIPWHVSRFHPNYRFSDREATPLETLETACQAGRDAGLKYLYVGNLPGGDAENSFCFRCGILLIKRAGYRVLENRVGRNGECPQCGERMEGVFLP